MPRKPANDVTISAFNFHLGRCDRTFRAEGLKHNWDGVVWLLPYDSRIADKERSLVITRKNWMHDSLSRSRVLGEVQRIKKYGERGDVLLSDADREKLTFLGQHCALQ